MPCLRAQWESFTADMDDNKKSNSLQPYIDLEIQLKPEQVEKVKGQLLSFAEGKVLWIVEGA
jgi:hypothetical protein